jgi:hypothetical protein
VTWFVDLLSSELGLVTRSANLYRPAFSRFLHTMADWTHVFKAVLDEHEISYVSAKGNPAERAQILKNIKDTILESNEAKDPSTMLPGNNVRKVSFQSLCLY